MEAQTRKLDEKPKFRATTDASLRALEARQLEPGPAVLPPPRPQTAVILRQTPRRFYGAILAALAAPLLCGGLTALLIWLHLLPPLPGLMPGFLGWCLLAACAAMLRSRSPLLLGLLGLAAGLPALGASLALNFQLVRVEGNSMTPTLAPGDVLLVDLRGSPREFARPGEEIYVLGGKGARPDGEPSIKRLVGAPGDRLEAMQGGLFLNGVRVRVQEIRFPGVLRPGLMLGEDEYFFLGDNSDDSRDSRDFGALNADSVRGRVVWRLRGAAGAGPVR